MKTFPTKPIEKIPIIILTGFLGSGKTTLLNSILAQAPHTAVIINEFGTTPIDPHLLKAHNILLSTLSGGCLCCQVRDALTPVLKNLRMAWENNREKPFDRIIIEASGVADPGPVIGVVLKQNWLSARYSLHGIIATISALSGDQTLNRFPDAQSQIAWADTVALTHTDLASLDQTQALGKRIKKLSPAASQLHVIKVEFALESLLGLSPQFRYLRPHPATGHAGHGFHSTCLQFTQPVAWNRLEAILLKLISRYGDSLVRVKGIIFDPANGHPMLVQVSAGTLYPPTPLPIRDADADDVTSRLVLITADPAVALEDDIIAQLDPSLS